jgi:hypothetical protein
VVLHFARLFVVGLIIPFVFSVIVYFGFNSNYSSPTLFSPQGFHDQYDTGIYRYRILGNWLLLKVDVLSKRYGIKVPAPKSLRSRISEADSSLYGAYFLQNSFFLCAASAVFYLLLSTARTGSQFASVDLPVFFMSALMAVTQYVVAPYDTLSYLWVA